MQTASFITSAKPSAAAKKALTEATGKIESLMSIVRATEPDRSGRISALHAAADAAEQDFVAAPTLENAEKFHDALVRTQDAQVSFARIDAAIHSLLPSVVESTIPAASEILDSAIAALDAEAATAKANVSKSATVFSDVGSIDAAHQAARAALEGHRAEINRDALGWLRMFGHA